MTTDSGCYATDAGCRSDKISSVHQYYFGNIRGTRFFGNSLSNASLFVRVETTIHTSMASRFFASNSRWLACWDLASQSLKKVCLSLYIPTLPTENRKPGEVDRKHLHINLSAFVPTLLPTLVWLYRVESFHCSVRIEAILKGSTGTKGVGFCLRHVRTSHEAGSGKKDHTFSEKS